VFFVSSNIRQRAVLPPSAEKAEKGKNLSALGERLTRNIAIATLVLLTVVGIREGADPPGGYIATIRSAVQESWDQNVGRLTYVSNTLADSISVFGRSGLPALTSPAAVSASDAWTEQTPYLIYRNAGTVYAAAAGEVTGIAHDENERFIIRISHDAADTVYYGLDACFVREGDTVTKDTALGTSRQEMAFEVRQGEKSLDCSGKLEARTP